MDQKMNDKLRKIIGLPSETEWIEFKEAKKDFDFEKLGRLFSALSNEANLNKKSKGCLIFGITDKPPRKVVGSDYRKSHPGLDRLKVQVADHTNHRITFREIHEVEMDRKRIVVFEIPPATRGIPTTWKGRAYGRVHDSLEPLTLNEIERIRQQNAESDWSAEICKSASIKDLDEEAIGFARAKFREKNPGIADEIDSWSEEEFLNRAKVCINGEITNAAVILLGKDVSDHLISPSVAQITWVLKDESGYERDYTHFGPPFILAVDKVYAKIRNLTYRHISGDSLFPTEVSQYDPYVIRETLNNCIAHQDYRKCARINVVENPDSLLFTNRGDFLPGSIEEVIRSTSPPELYRNRFLATAMVSLNMIDTIGTGIKKIFMHQRERSFPMPDYDLSVSGSVKVTITGKILDEKYTKLLVKRKDLTLYDVIALDKVQKGQSISGEEFKSLKSKKLIEGRRPNNLYISFDVAEKMDLKAEYIRNLSFDKAHFKFLIISYLENFDHASRSEIDRLLWDKVSDTMDDEQKKSFIKNLLQEMRKEGIIKRDGSFKTGQWRLTNSSNRKVKY